MMDFNPLWILAILTVLGLVIKGLFWLRDVHSATEGWSEFTGETFPEFAKEIREKIEEIFRRLPPVPAGVQTGKPAQADRLRRGNVEEHGRGGMG